MYLINTLLTIFSIVAYVNASTPSFKCKPKGSFCEFWNVQLNSSDYELQPTPNSTLDIRKVKFRGSKVTLLTNAICKTFPKIKELELVNQGVVVIEKNAFHVCESLEVLKLNDNKIVNLDKSSFYALRALKRLHLHFNHIKELHDEVFYSLENLTELSLGSNNLEEFPPDLLKYNVNLENLWIYSNDLADVDVEKILDNLPQLRQLELDDNEFSCTRMMEFIKLLKARNVHLNYAFDRKVRYSYVPEKIYGRFKCIHDAVWMTINYRKQFSFVVDMLERIEDEQKNMKELITTKNKTLFQVLHI